MKRLFELVKMPGRKKDRPTKDVYFNNKMEAKAVRDELNGGKLPDHDNGYRVVHGPDHWRRQGVL